MCWTDYKIGPVKGLKWCTWVPHGPLPPSPMKVQMWRKIKPAGKKFTHDINTMGGSMFSHSDLHRVSDIEVLVPVEYCKQVYTWRQNVPSEFLVVWKISSCSWYSWHMNLIVGHSSFQLWKCIWQLKSIRICVFVYIYIYISMKCPDKNLNCSSWSCSRSFCFCECCWRRTEKVRRGCTVSLWI